MGQLGEQAATRANRTKLAKESGIHGETSTDTFDDGTFLRFTLATGRRPNTSATDRQPLRSGTARALLMDDTAYG